MDSIFYALPPYLEFISHYRYFLLFLLGLFEGANTTVLIGILVSTGDLRFWPAYLLLTVGESINGFIWYMTGRLFGSRPINFLVGQSATKRRVLDRVTHYFERYSVAIILLAKMTFSLTNATLALAGSLKYDRKKFFWLNLLGSVGWVGMLVAFGYFFGQGYKFVIGYVRNVSYFIIFVIATVSVSYFITRVTRWIINRFLTVRDQIELP